MLVSDILSRSYLNDTKPEFDENTLIQHYILSFRIYPLVSPD